LGECWGWDIKQGRLHFHGFVNLRGWITRVRQRTRTRWSSDCHQLLTGGSKEPIVMRATIEGPKQSTQGDESGESHMCDPGDEQCRQQDHGSEAILSC
jgi:hypothetical protein